MALTSFVNLQTENFHVREPYISYAAYLRIKNALSNCLKRAKPHQFVQSGDKKCEGVNAAVCTPNY